MEYNLYAIKDTKVGMMSVHILPNNASAIRWFGDYATRQDNPMSAHLEDYQLFSLGTLDDQTGKIENEVKFLENATAFEKK